MEQYITDFVEYLQSVKKSSKNTILSYQRDLKKFAQYLKENGIDDIRKVNYTVMNAYMLMMEREHFAASTISRNIATLKAFFTYLQREHVVDDDPAVMLKAPKIEKKMPGVLSIEEVNLLLAQPVGTSNKEIRDKAMLELLYATGIRVSELISLKVSDVNLQNNYIRCVDGTKERVIPFGSAARAALKVYMTSAREAMIHSDEEDTLFTNCSGQPMSRQGFWKGSVLQAS
mgnify:FL=1